MGSHRLRGSLVLACLVLWPPGLRAGLFTRAASPPDDGAADQRSHFGVSPQRICERQIALRPASEGDVSIPKRLPSVEPGRGF